jgi:hypothetical protein
MGYQPTPINTSHVELNESLFQLTERLAEHTHDVWAQQRIADGWRWGAQRDDDQREHPCLVPYDQLPESEKEYDRQTAMGTIRALLALGWRLEPPA